MTGREHYLKKVSNELRKMDEKIRELEEKSGDFDLKSIKDKRKLVRQKLEKLRNSAEHEWSGMKEKFDYDLGDLRNSVFGAFSNENSGPISLGG